MSVNEENSIYFNEFSIDKCNPTNCSKEVWNYLVNLEEEKELTPNLRQLLTNKRFVYDILIQNPNLYRFLDKDLKNDVDIINRIICKKSSACKKITIETYRSIPEYYRSKKKFAVETIINQDLNIRNLEEYRYDSEIAIMLVDKNPDYFRKLDYSMRKNENVGRLAIQKSSNNVQYIFSGTLSDEELYPHVITTLKETKEPDLFDYIERNNDDKQLAYYAVANSTQYYYDLSDRLKDDFDICYAMYENSFLIHKNKEEFESTEEIGKEIIRRKEDVYYAPYREVLEVAAPFIDDPETAKSFIELDPNTYLRL